VELFFILISFVFLPVLFLYFSASFSLSIAKQRIDFLHTK